MDRNKLAILAGELGGYDQTASALDVSAELVQKAVEGDSLSGYENAILETGFNKLYLEDDRGLDLDALFGTRFDKFGNETDAGTVAGTVNLAQRFISDADLQNEFRALIAEGFVDVDSLTHDSIGLFANLTTKQAETVIEAIRDGEANAQEMFDAYVNDEYDFWDVEDSAFWEWFRETFYGDD